VQELMGFADMDDVVDKLIEQQQAAERMAQLKLDTMSRHESLVDEKARLDVAYEEQLGGVDSELTKRRQEYDAFVKAEKDHREARATHACMHTEAAAHARPRTHTHAHARTRTHTHAHARTRTHAHARARTRTHTGAAACARDARACRPSRAAPPP
jgi:hypothetical protein